MSKEKTPSNRAAAEEMKKLNPDGIDPISGERIGDESIKQLQKDMASGATVASVDEALSSGLDLSQHSEDILGDELASEELGD